MERQSKRNIEQENWLSMRILGERFIKRWDVHAIQTPDGRYVSIKKPITGRDLNLHLKGVITLGTYNLTKNDMTDYIVLDADGEVPHQQLFSMANDIAEEGIPSHMELSRRGGHLWFFSEDPISGKDAKNFGENLLQSHNINGVEVFPKQETISGGVGSLIRLPFGVHRKSGKVYPFVNIEDGLPIAETTYEQLLKLWRVKTVSKAAIEKYAMLESKDKETRTPTSAVNETQESVWSKIRASEPAINFIGRYVELTPTPTGAIGYCPFHEDEVPSFSVNVEGNYWNCFAGCGGGSIIDFYMKFKDVELGEAVHDLRKLLEV